MKKMHIKLLWILYIFTGLTSICKGQHRNQLEALEKLQYYQDINSKLKTKSGLTQKLLLDSIYYNDAMGLVWTAIEYNMDSKITDVYDYCPNWVEYNGVHGMFSYTGFDSIESFKKVEILCQGAPTIPKLSATAPIKIQHVYIYNNSNYRLEDLRYFLGWMDRKYVFVRDVNNNILSDSYYVVNGGVNELAWKGFLWYNSFNNDTMSTFHNSFSGSSIIYLMEGAKSEYNALQKCVMKKGYLINIYDSTSWHLKETTQYEYDTFGHINKMITIDDSILNIGNFKIERLYYYRSITALDSVILSYGSDGQPEVKRKTQYYYSNFVNHEDSVYEFDVDSTGNHTLLDKKYFEYDSLGNLIFESEWSYNSIIQSFEKRYDKNYFYSYHSVNATEAVDNLNNQFVVFPNPASGHLTVSCSQNSTSDSYRIEILNIQGQTILQQQIQQNQSDIDLRGLAKGVYILRLYSNDKTVVKRFVKE